MLADLPWVDELAITILAIDDQRIDVDTAIGHVREQLEATGATVNVHLDSGNPTTMIHRYLDDASPDLVALGTRGLTGLRHLRVGSTADKA